jgi:hypothetical protein
LTDESDGAGAAELIRGGQIQRHRTAVRPPVLTSRGLPVACRTEARKPLSASTPNLNVGERG